MSSIVRHLRNSQESISQRLVFCRFRTKGKGVISIINGYAPTSAAIDEQEEEFC